MEREELERKLQESYRKQKIANIIGVAAAIGSVMCTVAIIVLQTIC